MKSSNLSVQFKIMATLTLVFLSLMFATTWHTASNERGMTLDLAKQKAIDSANSYFDGINTMMLTGTMAQRDLLRQKYLAQPNITEARLIRAPVISKIFGPGFAEQSPTDALDQRALNGEHIIEIGEDAQGRVVTVLEPILASSNFRGTNCITCHQIAENTVMGASRISYSLAELDEQVNTNLVEASAINVVMLILGMAVFAWSIRHIVVCPLQRIRDTMHRMEMDANLAQRLEVKSGDEIGQLANAFNAMLDKFSKGLSQVADTTAHLNSAASDISAVAEQTAQAAFQQRSETDNVATAINELEATAMQVGNGAASASEASIEADRTATDGARTTREAIDGIHALVAEIETASGVIMRLDDRSKNVGTVLDVIKNIAEQTNLLALNAAIEAARAGEQGRGFAVVADEVRTLATRSHESTQEIENIVEQLQREAKEAVATMNQAKESAEHRRSQVESADSGLIQIAEHVAHIRTLNAQMENAASEQSVVTQDISRNVVSINGLAEQTARDATQTTEASRSLLELSQRLQSLVGQFRL